ncbi:major royal jelly family protein [Terriglobus tenax]|uniref:major royal jelly family protein n=1 Tax=Terriglobus tenax TaxID=1111115 RepID=UPI0021DF826D|nr:major royal jelly family protein [Terriglobus tenax]
MDKKIARMKSLACTSRMLAFLLAVFTIEILHGQSPDLQKAVAITAQEPITGVTTTRDGKVFVLFPHLDGHDGTRVAQVLADGSFRPFPDEEWNRWRAGMDSTQHLVGPNSIRVGDDGLLWVVDTGTRGFGSSVIPGAAKLVGFDPSTGVVRHQYPLNAAVRSGSYVDDVRFVRNTAIFTDAGDPGLILLDMKSGAARRVLDHENCVTAKTPMRASGALLQSSRGPVSIHADQLEISPDREWLYFQPASGPLSRVAVKDLLDRKLLPQQLVARVHLFAHTPSTGGTAMTSKGILLVSDVDKHQLLAIDPKGKIRILLSDPQLAWVDAMWIDEKQNLWMPAAQLDRLPLFQGGRQMLRFPIQVYRVSLVSLLMRRE